jgi:hypothetical protein
MVYCYVEPASSRARPSSLHGSPGSSGVCPKLIVFFT